MIINKKKENKVVTVQLQLGGEPKKIKYSEALAYASDLYTKAKFADCSFLAEQLLSLMPKNIDAGNILANSYLVTGKLDLAATVVGDLLRRYPRVSSVLNVSAKYHQQVDDIDEAIDVLNRSRQFDNKNASTYLLLGECYASIGEKQKAIKCFDYAISLNPNDGGAFYQRCHLDSDSVSEGQANKMVDLFAEIDTDSVEKIKLSFGLAWYYKDRDTDKEFKYLAVANSLMSKLRPWSVDDFLEQEKVYFDIFDEDSIPSVMSLNKSDFSPVFIVSTPRAGTTLLEQILASHSGVESIGESGAFYYANGFAGKEMEHSSIDDVSESYEKYFSLIDSDFRKRLSKVINDESKVIVDKSMDNLLLIGLILAVYPKAKILHLRRDPMDVCLSCYRLLFSVGVEYSYDLKSCMSYVLSHGRVVEKWKQLFPDRILTIDYESLVDDIEKTTREVFSFCDLSWEEESLAFYNNNRSVRTASFDQVKRPVYKSSVGKWQEYREQLEPALVELEKYKKQL